jgi:glycosyltransferase involved in cell wall biosynthesis
VPLERKRPQATGADFRPSAGTGWPAPASRNTLPKAPVSVLVLTYNEESNIGACLDSAQWAAEVFVVDSLSTDRTAEVARERGAVVFSHPFQGYAEQRNWALSHLPFSFEWVLVVDADERVTPGLAGEIQNVVSSPTKSFDGYYVKRRLFFLGRWLVHSGPHRTWILRLFRREAGRFENRAVNEHVLLAGQAGYLHEPLDHCDQHPLSDWVAKHNRYASLEAEERLNDGFRGNHQDCIAARFWGPQVERNRWVRRHIWNRLPLLARPLLFFFRNYVVRLGFLDGIPGLVFHVLWSFWYQFLIDAKIIEARLTGRDRKFRGRA